MQEKGIIFIYNYIYKYNKISLHYNSIEKNITVYCLGCLSY